MVLFDIKINGLSPKNGIISIYNINMSIGCLGPTPSNFLLPVVPVMPAVDPTPLVLPADFPEAVSLLQPEAVSNIRVYLALLSGQKEEKDLIMRESSLPLTLGDFFI
ncbi:MAG: hypothetical protein MUO68_17625 [Desulfobacteraceae bacterium]|nr:hypothetical protein [Desulfobacteraceae bacterium]